MKNLIYALLLFIFMIPVASHAQVRGLLISPKRIVFEKGERLHELRLVNRGDETQRYRISVVNRRMTENGQLEPAEIPAENEFFADKVLRYGPRQIDLAPKEAQTVRLMSRLTGNHKDGEYRSHILIQEIPKPAAARGATDATSGDLGINVQAVFGMSIPVFFRKGDLSAEVSLSNPSIVHEEDVTYARFNIDRSGNKSIFGTAKVFMEGKEIAILKGIAVYLSAPTRIVSVEIPQEYARSITGKKLRITFGAIQNEEDAPSTEISFVAG